MTKHGLHDDFQSAYKPGFSTETVLLKVKDYIQSSFDNCNGVLLAMIDMSAAFDTLSHDILLARLCSEVGISGSVLMWFKSYLANRCQSVLVGDTLSDSKELLVGVPQLSVLGPLLYLIYMLPVKKLFSNFDVNYHAYADDFQVYIDFNLNHPSDLDIQLLKLEKCIYGLKSWLTANKLKVNDEKTEFIIMYPKRFSKNICTENCVLSLGNSKIKPTEKVRNLGSVFDSHMSMEPNVSAVIQRGYNQLRGIGKIRRFLDHSTCAHVIHGLLTSRLDFNNSLLAGLPAASIKRLQTMQNHAARLLSGTGRCEHITPTLSKLHWLPVLERIKFKVLSIVHKCVYGNNCP